MFCSTTSKVKTVNMIFGQHDRNPPCPDAADITEIFIFIKAQKKNFFFHSTGNYN